MNYKFIIYLFFLKFITGTELFGMVKKASIPSKILPVSSISQFMKHDSRLSPSISTFPSYDYFSAIDNNNIDTKNSWKNSKWFKYPVFTTGLVGIGSYAFFKAIKNAVFKISQDAADQDPELYEIFLKIKDDYGITEDVGLRILIPLENLDKKYPSHISEFLKKL